MKQYEAVIKVMEDNGGYATLGFLNQEVLKIRDCVWNTKTPLLSAFVPVRNRTLFLSYTQVSDWHTKTHELSKIEYAL